MIMKNRFLLFIVISVIVLSSCGSTENDISNTSDFPINPDKIIIGADGQQKEILPQDKAYSEIVSLITERIKKSDKLDSASLDDHDTDSGKHLSFELQKNETYVEFVYNECVLQKFDMLQNGGTVTAKAINVQCVFFSLTGEYHNCFFVGKDADYEDSITIGPLADNTTLITYIKEMLEK